MEPIDFLVCVRCFTYNHASYIEDAMNGFCMQKTSFPYVCVIVDDASTDGEPEIIEKYIGENFDLGNTAVVRNEETDDYYFTFAQHKSNKNCFLAVYLLKYNHYKKKDKFQYFSEFFENVKYHALCEGDDYWIDLNKLQEQVSFMESHPSYAFSHTAIKYYFEEGNRICKSKDVGINSKIINKGLTPEKILLNYRIQYCTVVYRLDAYKSARFSDPHLFNGNFKMGDTQLWYQLYKEGNIYFYPEVCAIYRKHAGSATMEKNVYNNLQFTLSSAELRMYLAQRDGLSDDFCKYVQKWYNKSFIKCLAFDNSLSAKYPVNLKEDKLLYALYKTHLLKHFLQIYMSIDPWLSTIKRLLTGSM